mmetsp:Transcript_26083/g.55890  ORF Transcript_26083/g.55890 Transcript_26083/m.55890 type:complete len:274 (-) Transcript_26083:618-1439(-)
MELCVGDPILDGRTLCDPGLGSGASFLGRHFVFVFPQLVPVFRQFDFRWVLFVVLSHHQRLREREPVASKPVDGQGGRHLQRKETDQQGQKFEDVFGLVHLLLRFGVHVCVVGIGWLQCLHGESLSQHQHYRHDAKGQRGLPSQLWRPEAIDLRPPLRQPVHSAVIVRGRNGSLQAGNPQEGFVEFPVHCQQTDTAVQSQKDGQLEQRQEATGEWILVGVLVQLSDQLVLAGFVVFEFGVDLVHVGFEGLGHFSRFGLLETQRNQQGSNTGRK